MEALTGELPGRAAERPNVRSHAERGNEEKAPSTARLGCRLAAPVVLVLLLMPNVLHAQLMLPEAIRDVGFDQKLDAPVPLELAFRDETGQTVQLRDYFDGKPVILVLAYYRCPMLCDQVLNGLVKAMLDLPFDAGKEFNVVTVSFDPREQPELAAAKRKNYLERYGRPSAEHGWHFLTGTEPNIKKLADAVGFRYVYDEKHDRYNHASGIMLLTPEGKVSRYFFDVRFSPRDLRLGLVEASQNRIGSAADQVLLYCFHYDPAEGKYGAAILNFVRAGGALTVVALGVFIYCLRRGDPRPPQPATLTTQTTAGRSDLFAQIIFFPQRASTTAYSVDLLLYVLVSVTGAVALLVALVMLYFVVRYRRRPGVAPQPSPHTNLPLELTWTAVPLAIFMVLFVWGAMVYFDAYRAPDDATVIYGIGKQWMWKFQHPEGQREINELHVPIGRPIKIMLTSEDVIHSFFVPDFRTHMDVLPGRYTSVWFEPTTEGTYHLFCSQYCGTNHAGMIGKVVVMQPKDYADWLDLHAEGSMALQGRKVFLKYRCLSCHSADENARAPVLEELYGKPVHLNSGRTVIANEDYLRESILAPSAKIVAGWQPIMPTFEGQVTQEEINELIAFIRSLRRGQTPSRVEAYPPPVATPPINPKGKTP